MRITQLLIAAVLVGLGISLVASMFVMTVNCVYVPEGHSLQLQYKGPLLLIVLTGRRGPGCLLLASAMTVFSPQTFMWSVLAFGVGIGTPLASGLFSLLSCSSLRSELHEPEPIPKKSRSVS